MSALAEAIRTATGGPLDAEDARIAGATYEHLLTGARASVDDLATAAGVAPADVESFLSGAPGVYRDEDGRVVGFWGLSVIEMPPHRLVGDGPPVYFWCAWDPIIIAPVVGRSLIVETQDPSSKDPVRFTATPDGVIDASPAGATLSFLRPSGEWDADVIASFCHYVLAFTDDASARAWTDEHPGTFVLGFNEGVRLAREAFVPRFAAARSGD